MKETLQERLSAHPFTRGMSPRHLQLLASAAAPAEFAAGAKIFREGEKADGFYLIESGRVALEGSVHDHGKVTTDFVLGGEPLGWSWIFPPYVWHFSARAIEPVTALRLSAPRLRQHRDNDLTFAHELFRRASEVMVHRLQHTRRQLVALKGKPPR